MLVGPEELLWVGTMDVCVTALIPCGQLKTNKYKAFPVFCLALRNFSQVFRNERLP
jgi:hypothetical protein